MKILLTVFGFLCVALGILGIFLPLLPTTPFLLLAAWCFAKSSEKFYNWLLNHKHLGSYIKTFRSKEGVPPRMKIKAIVVMWSTMGASAYFMKDIWWALLGLLACALGITMFLISLPSMGASPLSETSTQRVPERAVLCAGGRSSAAAAQAEIRAAHTSISPIRTVRLSSIVFSIGYIK